MVVEAKVAIESHEMGRGVDGLDFASSQILRSGRAGQLSFRSGRPEPKGRTVTTEMYVPSSRIRGLREHQATDERDCYVVSSCQTQIRTALCRNAANRCRAT